MEEKDGVRKWVNLKKGNLRKGRRIVGIYLRGVLRPAKDGKKGGIRKWVNLVWKVKD